VMLQRFDLFHITASVETIRNEDCYDLSALVEGL